MPLRLVDELEKDVVDGTSNESAEVEEFAIDTMKGGLEEISFSRIFAVEELKKVEHERLINVALCDVCVEVRALNESQKELVDNLEMWPSEFQYRLIFLGIKGVANRINLRRN